MTAFARGFFSACVAGDGAARATLGEDASGTETKVGPAAGRHIRGVGKTADRCRIR